MASRNVRPPLRVLHLVPLKFVSPDTKFLGSTKDISSRLQYFKDRGIPVDLMPHNPKEPIMLEALRQVTLDEYTHILIEKGNHAKVMKYLRRQAPQAEIWFRGHNAELPHRIDYIKAAIHSAPDRKNMKRHIENIAIYGMRDFHSARLADRVLAICDFEVKHYWNRMGLRKRAVNVPFFLTEEYVSTEKLDVQKEQLCICFTSSHPGPVTNNAVQKFFGVLRAVKGKTGNWKFVVSGRLSPELNEEAKALGVEIRWFETPGHALAAAKAMVILSDYGRGFKTKLLEALAYKTFIISSPGLYERLPQEILPYCLSVNPRKPDTFLAALEKCRADFPAGDPNEKLKEVAYRNLDELFGREAHA